MTNTKAGFGWGYLLIGLLLAVVGVGFMTFSGALYTLAIIIGVTLIAFGVVYVAIAASRQKKDVGFAVKIVVAVFSITAGIITIILRESAVMIMADIFCLLLIVDGSFKFQTAALSKRYKAFGWWFMLALSVITIASAFIVSKIKTPETEPGIITVVLGVIILVDGIANFFTAFYEAYCEKRRTFEIEAGETEEPVLAPIEEPVVDETTIEESDTEGEVDIEVETETNEEVDIEEEADTEEEVDTAEETDAEEETDIEAPAGQTDTEKDEDGEEKPLTVAEE
jgi:uncharacterized membrane protein HdeD (DUF308 family)